MLQLAIVCKGTREVLYCHAIKLSLIQVRFVFILLHFYVFSDTYFIT